MTDTSRTAPAGTCPDPAATLPPSVAKVLTALRRLGEATAAGTAAEAGLGYSTTTPKLRALEKQGLAEPARSHDGRTLWRLTDAGRAYAEHSDESGPAGTGPSSGPSAGTDTADMTAPDRGRSDAADDDTPEHLDHAAAATADVPNASGHDTDDPRDPTAADTMPGDEAGEHADAADPATGARPPAGGAGDTAARDGQPDPAHAKAPPAAEPAAEPAASTGGRRASGTLRGAILDILEAHPDQPYKTGELCRLIDQADEGTGAKKASPGAVHNAAVKLVETGRAVQVVDKPATFALASTDDSGCG